MNIFDNMFNDTNSENSEASPKKPARRNGIHCAAENKQKEPAAPHEKESTFEDGRSKGIGGFPSKAGLPHRPYSFWKGVHPNSGRNCNGCLKLCKNWGSAIMGFVHTHDLGFASALNPAIASTFTCHPGLAPPCLIFVAGAALWAGRP